MNFLLGRSPPRSSHKAYKQAGLSHYWMPVFIAEVLPLFYLQTSPKIKVSIER